MAARLAAWRRVTQQGVILYVMDCHAACPDGPQNLPRSVADLLLNVHKKRRATSMDQISKKTPNPKCRLFLKIDLYLAAGVYLSEAPIPPPPPVTHCMNT
jgi:hypothetical protein